MAGLSGEKTVKPCVACGGTGLSSKGRPCTPCMRAAEVVGMELRYKVVQDMLKSGELKITCLGKELLDD